MSVVHKKKSKQTARRVAYIAVGVAILAAPALAIAGGGGGFFPPAFSLKSTVNIPGSPLASFDISWVDPSVHKYFLADRSNKSIDVIDTRTKSVTQLIPTPGFAGVVKSAVPNALNGPNGVLTISGSNDFDHDGDDHGFQIWAGDGPSTTTTCPGAGNFITICSTVKVLDLTGNVLHNIPTGGAARADELCYDPADHLIQIANDSDTPPFISFIPTEGPNAYKVVKQIKFDGLPGDGPNATNGIEQCQWNARNGKIYLNVPEVNGTGNDTADGQTLIIDPRKMEIVKTFDIPVGECAGPQGMAIGPAPQIMLGCNAAGPPNNTGPANTAVLDENSGHLIKVLANQGGNDEVWFNPGDGLYFLAEGQNPIAAQLGIVASEPIFVSQDIFIAPAGEAGHAHSVAADPIKNEAYFPIPNNGGSNLCPTANGCVAIFGTDVPGPFVYRGH